MDGNPAAPIATKPREGTKMTTELDAFREAGRNGLAWTAAVAHINPALDDDPDPEEFDAAGDAFDEGQRERVRAEVERGAASLSEPHMRSGDGGEWVEVADRELTARHASSLIEWAAQAAPIEPEEIVEIVGEFCPLPRNALRLAEMALHDFQYIPARRADYARKGESPPEVHRPLTKAEAQAQIDAAIAKRREAMGLPPVRSLRFVDYQRGGSYAPPSWLVRNLIPRRGLGLLYGESSAGKTFLAIHASLCLAWGVPFFGRRVKPGGVLYIAAEGGRSVLPRFDAAERGLGIGAANLTGQRDASAGCAPIRIVYEAPNLSRAGDPAPLIATIREAAEQFEAAGSRLAMVVVDTWHAALAGAEENSSADTGHALKPLKDAIEEMGVFVLVVHHPGKELEKGARGSVSLPAAVDTTIELRVPGCLGPLAKPAEMMRTATVVKQRDGAVGESFHYRLPITKLGLDEDGEPWTTCTVQPCDPPRVDDDGLSKTDRQFMEAVQAAIAEVGGASPAEIEKARGRFYNSRANDKPDTRRKAWNRALAEAQKAGRVELDYHDHFIWIPAEPAGERDTDTGS